MMRNLIAAGLFAAATAAGAQTYTTLELPALNTDIRTWSDGGAYVPLIGTTQTWNGVPFALTADASGHTAFLNGVLDIPVDVFGVTKAYTIINSAYGSYGAYNGSVEFFGETGYFKVDLVQGVNVRDHYNGWYNNVIDGVNAVPAFSSSGGARLDQQIYLLPASFADEKLVSIRFTGLDSGGIPFIAAATVAAVPEPATAVLFALGALALAATEVRRRRAQAR
jgi:hypothetical protein